MNGRTQKNVWKRLIIFVLMVSFVLSQYMPAQAASKKSSDTIALNRTVYTLKKGKTVTLKASLSKSAEKKGVVWTSSNPKTASVSKNGKVTALKNGKTVITAKIKGTSIRAKSQITVGTPVSRIKLNRNSLSLEIGQKYTLKTTISPAKASVKDVSYASSNSKVASVSKKGVVRAVSAGTAVIRVTAADGSGKKASCAVKVTKSEEPASGPEEPENPEGPQEPEDTGSGKILAAYFSWSGTSERIAKDIIEQTGADAFRIERETPYSDNYSEVAYGEAKDEADNNARPPIKNPLASLEQYDRIILCYPIWWHTAPMTVGTFLESYDFTGKHIYPVSQSASMDTTQYAQSVEFIKGCAKGAVVDDGIFSKDNSAIRSYIADKVLQQ